MRVCTPSFRDTRNWVQQEYWYSCSPQGDHSDFAPKIFLFEGPFIFCWRLFLSKRQMKFIVGFKISQRNSASSRTCFWLLSPNCKKVGSSSPAGMEGRSFATTESVDSRKHHEEFKMLEAATTQASCRFIHFVATLKAVRERDSPCVLRRDSSCDAATHNRESFKECLLAS